MPDLLPTDVDCAVAGNVAVEAGVCATGTLVGNALPDGKEACLDEELAAAAASKVCTTSRKSVTFRPDAAVEVAAAEGRLLLSDFIRDVDREVRRS